MRSRTIGALAKGARLAGSGMGALFLSAVLAAGLAFAYATWNDPTDTAVGLGCDYAIDHSEASCLHGWWDNTPPASTGVAGGSTWGVQSQCGAWGSVYGRVRTGGNWERGYLLTNSDKKRGYDWTDNVNNIKCCPSKGELCHKSQVRARDGVIEVWNGSSYDSVDVGTKEKRQHFCAQLENRDGVYCRNDLSGDAMETNAYNCGDHYCDAGDCRWHFEQSRAYGTCRGEDGDEEPAYEIAATDGSSQTCTVTAQCKEDFGAVVHSDGTVEAGAFWTEKRLTANVWHLDDAVNCNGQGDRLVNEATVDSLECEEVTGR